MNRDIDWELGELAASLGMPDLKFKQDGVAVDAATYLRGLGRLVLAIYRRIPPERD